ncbi:major pollen allergen Ole e 10-like [Hibiscus syriacus]|uniref:major pollen allergen Ole e 10-like n=1 Tax=Hibiscus syriacus TaxID=106335 RepID=UPI00192057F1|nr:major pollen allergen Ole e 10-like [Hibiscus syriacus]
MDHGSSISRKPPFQEIDHRKQSNRESRLLVGSGTTPNPTTPSTEPITNPTTPITTPTTQTPTPTTSSGGSWCIANQGASPTALQVALDYACGYGGADCSAIQSGGSCYEPDTVQDHAFYAFNDYTLLQLAVFLEALLSLQIQTQE